MKKIRKVKMNWGEEELEKKRARRGVVENRYQNREGKRPDPASDPCKRKKGWSKRTHNGRTDK